MILSEAVRLFRERGFHGVGIDDIGDAVGITGPAVYRHFKNKNDLLVAAVSEAGRLIILGLTIADDATVEDALRGAIRAYARVVVENRDLIGVYIREQHNLSESDQRRSRRGMRFFAEEWVHLVSRLQPQRSDAEVRVAVQGALGLLNSVCNDSSGLPSGALVAHLESMALAALTAPSQEHRRR